jgi:hypothetical protein
MSEDARQLVHLYLSTDQETYDSGTCGQQDWNMRCPIMREVQFSTNDQWHVGQEIKHVFFLQEKFVISPCKPIWKYLGPNKWSKFSLSFGGLESLNSENLHFWSYIDINHFYLHMRNSFLKLCRVFLKQSVYIYMCVCVCVCIYIICMKHDGIYPACFTLPYWKRICYFIMSRRPIASTFFWSSPRYQTLRY